MGNNMFQNMKTEGLEKSEDRLGGFAPLETDIYTGKIKAAYAGTFKSGAMNVTLILALPHGKEYRETICVSNKNGENFFIDSDTKKKQPLPGFTIVNDVCLIALDGAKELYQVETEEKIVKIYDYESKKDVNTPVQMLMELLGKEVSVAIEKVLENKQKEGPDGKYHDTAETREVNNIVKVFHPVAKVTVAEARVGKTEEGSGEFWDAWLTKYKGVTKDKRTIKDGQAPAGTKPAGGGSSDGPPKKSLFGKK